MRHTIREQLNAVASARACRGIWALLIAAAFCMPPALHAQGSRKDDIVFNAQGRHMAGATVRVCTATATGQPCSPLANIYSDPAMTQALANPTTTDGLGNYSFYAAPGRYEIEVSGPSITTKQMPNVILPNDPSAPTFTTITSTSGISAFSLSLAGNLTVNGSTAVTGSLTVGGAPVPSTSQANSWTAPQTFSSDAYFASGRPWFDVMAFNASASSQATTGTSVASSATLALAAAMDFKNGQGIAVYHAGPNIEPATPVGSFAQQQGTITSASVHSGGGGSGWAVGDKAVVLGNQQIAVSSVATPATVTGGNTATVYLNAGNPITAGFSTSVPVNIFGFSGSDAIFNGLNITLTAV